MNAVIAEVLKANLENLQWMERFGGLVFPYQVAQFKTDAEGKQVITGYQVYPVACEVNLENCYETGTIMHFEPDSTKSAIGFFVDNGGVTLKSVEGPKNATLKFAFDLKFLCWMNTARLGSSITAGLCQPSGRIAPYVVAEMFGEQSAVGVFAGGIEESIFYNIEVTGVRELTKTPAMFEPFSFARWGVDRGLFTTPYDYFGLQIQGTFTVNKNCLPDFGDGWQPTVGCLAPAGDIDWFSRRAIEYFASLPEFSSNEDALAGIDPDGNATTALVVGDNYWASSQHVAGADAFMRVV